MEINMGRQWGGRQAEKQTELERRGGVTEGREGAKDGHSLTVQDGGGGEGGRMRGMHSAERKGRATKATMRRREERIFT